jgi:bifunctional non-homologous end joining protein LigD
MLLSNHKVTPISLSDDRLLYEPKFDGWRILIHKDGNRTELFTRHGKQISDRFPELVKAAATIPARSAIIDAEGICFDPHHKRPDFGLFSYRGMLTRTERIEAALRTHPATLIPFDVIMLDGINLCGETLLYRKQLLSSLIPPGPALMATTFVKGNGHRLYNWTRENHWEGLVAKVAGSRYVLNHRSSAWVKWKHTTTASAVVLGYKVRPFALLVGLPADEGVYPAPAAMVEFGFTPEEKRAFTRIASQIHTRERQSVQMVEPLVRCKVEYLEKTETGALRNCTFRGFEFAESGFAYREG